MKSTLFLPLLFSTVYAQADTLAADRQRKKTCLDQCEDQDVDCKAICDHAPHPKPIHMNLMTECVQHCDVLKGDGNAVDLEKYGICRDGCIGGYMNLGNTQAAPTTKTWVDLVTPTPTSYLEKAVSETVSVSASASELEHDHSGHDHSHTEAAGNKSASGEFCPPFFVESYSSYCCTTSIPRTRIPHPSRPSHLTTNKTNNTPQQPPT